MNAWLQFAILLALAILIFAGIGFVATVRFIRHRCKRPRVDKLSLARTDKLVIVEEVLGAAMPESLAYELRTLRMGSAPVPIPPAPRTPAEIPGTAQVILSSAEAAPAGVVVSASKTGAENEHLVDGSADPLEGLTVPGGTLEVAPEIAHLARRAKPGLGAFFSFETTIFLLSAVLILGGSLYFAAVTWRRVPGSWQYFFVQLVTAFYGVLMLVGARILNRRLGLDKAARILIAIAGGVSLLCAAIGAGAYFQSGLAGLAGTFLAAAFAYACAHFLLKLIERPTAPAVFFAAAAAMLALAGAAQIMGSAVGSGLALLLASGLAVTRFAPADREFHPVQGLLAAAVPLVGVLLSATGRIALADTAPGLAMLGWFVVTGRTMGFHWMPLAGVLLIGSCMLAAADSLGALTVTALIGAVVLWRSAQSPAGIQDRRVDKFALMSGIGAGLLWIYVSVSWMPAIGLLLPRETIVWLIDIVTRSGERVSASWAGLATLPAMALALWHSDRLRRADNEGMRALLAELAGAGVFAAGTALALVTFERQPVPAGLIMLVLAGAWAYWSYQRQSALRLAASHVVVLLGLFSMGSAVDGTWAALLPSLAALVMAAAPSMSSRGVACLAAPVFALGAVADGQAHTLWPVVILLLSGVVQLWQPGPKRHVAVTACGPPTLLIGWLVALMYNPSGPLDAVIDNDWALLAVALFVLGAAVVVALRRGPHFLTMESCVAALGVAATGIVIAFDHGPGHAESVINGSAAITALLALLLCTRGATRPWNWRLWLVAAYAFPLPVAMLFDIETLWPGAIAASLGMLALLVLSRGEHAGWLAGFGFVEGLLAAWWWTLFVAAFLSSGGGPERILTPLGTVTALAGLWVAIRGSRHSGASPEVVRHFSVIYLLLGLAMGGIGMFMVEHPKPIDMAMSLVNLGMVAAISWLLATRQRSGWLIYITEGVVAGMYGYVRFRSDWLDGLAAYDGVVMVLCALGLSGLSHLLRLRRIELGLLQTQHMAALIPLAMPFAMEWDGTFSDSLGMALAGAHYALLARLDGRQRYAWLAALALNVMLMPIWQHPNYGSPMSYLMPAGMTLMVMARLYRQALQRAAPVLRTLAALLVLGSTSMESFAFDSLWPALLLGALAVAAALLGMAWRQRAYLYMGFVFLLLDIVVNLTRWGMTSRLIFGSIGVITGLALFAIGVGVTRHKAELLAHYQRVQGWEW